MSPDRAFFLGSQPSLNRWVRGGGLDLMGGGNCSGCGDIHFRAPRVCPNCGEQSQPGNPVIDSRERFVKRDNGAKEDVIFKREDPLLAVKCYSWIILARAAVKRGLGLK